MSNEVDGIAMIETSNTKGVYYWHLREITGEGEKEGEKILTTKFLIPFENLKVISYVRSIEHNEEEIEG